MSNVRAHAPGRVNLIGDHTDYTGGLVCPMAIGLGTTVEGERDGDTVALRSLDEPGTVELPLRFEDARSVEPPWGRFVAGVVAVLRPAVGFRGSVSSTLPLGAGLSSSSAFTVALALALGFDGEALELARRCQEAEALGTGVPGGIMDQLTSAAGVAGHALVIDCTSFAVDPVPVPDDVDVLVVHSGQRRALAASAYAERRSECERAAQEIGPLRDAGGAAVAAIADPVIRARARHVVTENARVAAFADALRSGDAAEAGRLMVESHVSLRDDFDVSTAALEATVSRLLAIDGVLGARLTGAGFGGCVVALARPGVRAPTDLRSWRVRAVGGASVVAR